MRDASYVPNTAPYGYRKTDGKFTICESEAQIVKQIFENYLNGIGLNEIAQNLNSEKIPKGENTNWTYRSISYILSNEKYLGDSKYHKWYTPDILPFRSIENRGEKEMLYANNTHEAIIEKSVFDQAQILLKKRGLPNIGKASDSSPLRKKIFCQCCGATFKRRKVNGKFYWVCRNHDASAENCRILPVPESEIYSAFIRLQNKLAVNSKNILTPMLRQLQELSDKGISGNVQVSEIRKEIAEIKDQQHLMATLKSQGILDAAYYAEHSSQLDRKLLNLQNQLHCLMGNMRTLAFQVPEKLFQRIKEHLQQTGMTQKEFMLGLIDKELDQSLVQRAEMVEVSETVEENTEAVSEEIAEQTEEQDCGDVSEDFDEEQDESEYMGMGMSM